MAAELFEATKNDDTSLKQQHNLGMHDLATLRNDDLTHSSVSDMKSPSCRLASVNPVSQSARPTVRRCAWRDKGSADASSRS